jgi:hypothetical protein
MARQRKVAKLLLREAYVFDDLFEKRLSRCRRRMGTVVSTSPEIGSAK